MTKLAFIDMDGVLCDYNSATQARFGIKECVYNNPKNLGRFHLNDILREQYNISNGQFYSSRRDDFYANLDWTTEGKSLLKMVEDFFGKDNCYILTNPGLSSCDWSAKCVWINKNMSSYLTKGRVMMARAKWTVAKSNTYLFDDKDSNIIKFNEAGGNGILIPRKWNSEHTESGSILEKIKKVLEEV